MKHAAEPKQTPLEMMQGALADWMFDTIIEIGNVNEESDLNEVGDVVLDFIWPDTEEEGLTAFIWIMKEYGLVLFSNTTESRWDYILMNEDDQRRFVGVFEDE